MRLHNTRTHSIENFAPLQDNTVRMYSCGPTVYNHAHIGNLSSYIYADALRRTLKAAGYAVKHVMNFTDVDDKTIRDSRLKYPQDEPMAALTKFTTHYEHIFLEEMAEVGNNTDDITFVKATDNISDIQQLICKLLKQGDAYVADDGVYFSIQQYQEDGRTYGQLTCVECRTSSCQRINNDEYDKDHAHDFALWKAQKEGEPAWDFTLPDGSNMPGRPGWHIECSVMSVKNLGQPFDIHTGGVDLIFPHHENEIAQSTAGNQPAEYANFFVHNEHLLVNGAKMSKSAHNFYTLPDLVERSFSPLDFRLLVLQSHYRSATNFSWETLEAAKNRRRHWCNVAELRHQVSDNPSEEQIDKVSQLVEQAQDAMENDLDTPNALKYFDEAFDLFKPEQTDLGALDMLLTAIDQLLGLKLIETTPDIAPEDYELIDERQQARHAKDWTKSDQLRDELAKRGIQIKDGPTPIWSRC